MPKIHYELPDDLHRRAKAAAAMRGQSLKDFIIEALEVAVEEPATPKPKPPRRRA